MSPAEERALRARMIERAGRAATRYAVVVRLNALLDSIDAESAINLLCDALLARCPDLFAVDTRDGEDEYASWG